MTAAAANAALTSLARNYSGAPAYEPGIKRPIGGYSGHIPGHSDRLIGRTFGQSVIEAGGCLGAAHKQVLRSGDDYRHHFTRSPSCPGLKPQATSGYLPKPGVADVGSRILQGAEMGARSVSAASLGLSKTGFKRRQLDYTIAGYSGHVPCMRDQCGSSYSNCLDQANNAFDGQRLRERQRRVKSGF